MARRVPAEGRRAAQTRQRIIDAAIVAFAAKGYAATSVTRDVLEPSGVSVGSFYHQFAGKPDLFAAVVTDASAAAQRTLSEGHDKAEPDGPQQVSAASWRLLLKLVDAYEPLFRIHLRERVNPDPEVAEPIAAVKAAWADVLRRAFFSSSELPAGFPADRAAKLVAALGLGVIQSYLDREPAEREAGRDQLSEELATFTIGGLTALHPW